MILVLFSAVVFVQRVEQSNVPQQQLQQAAGAPPMTFPGPPVRYFSPEYRLQCMHTLFILLFFQINFFVLFIEMNKNNRIYHALTTDTILLPLQCAQYFSSHDCICSWCCFTAKCYDPSDWRIQWTIGASSVLDVLPRNLSSR